MSNLSQPSLSERLSHAPIREPHDEWTAHDLTKTAARGSSPATPFVVLGGVALTVWSAVVAVGLVALLISWLV